MKPPLFSYLRAASLEEALGALAEQGGDARILAGGQSLVPMLNMRLARPSLLIDIMRVAPLARVAIERGALLIGAAARQEALLQRPTLSTESPLLAQALPSVGHWQTRVRGTVCGSVAHADPSAEIPLCLVALGATVHLRSQRKRRTLAAAQFFLGTMTTDRADDEMIEAVSVPLAPAGSRYGFAEVGRRNGDFAMVAAAAVVTPSEIRLAIAGVADRPVLEPLPSLDGSALDDALNAFAWSLGARDDAHASARYRRDLVRRLGRRVIETARR